MNLSFDAMNIDDVTPIEVGPGCYRRDLPSNAGMRVWIVDMEPGSTWPVVDEHDTGEEFYVIRGEVIEGDRRLGAGMYATWTRGSSHRPYTETGVRLIGINLAR